jgi:CHAD domain-containing protein
LEIEAKFKITDEATFRRLLKTPSLAGFHLGEATVVSLHDQYLDTADWAIRAWGYACRLRRSGERYLVTIKGLGGASGAIHRRAEYEVELPGPLPVREWPPSAARDLALRLCGSEPLRLLFEVEQTRHSRLLSDGERTLAGLSLDRVQVQRGDRSEPYATFLELEAELMPGGSDEDLARLGAELEEDWGLVPASRSKYERGLAFFDVGLALDEEAEKGMEQRLTPKERAIAELLTHEPEVVARRARLLLAWDDGLSRAAMVESSGLSPRRVRHWLSAFSQQRLGIFPERILRTFTGADPAPSRPVPEEALSTAEGEPIERDSPAAEEGQPIEAIPATSAEGLMPEEPSGSAAEVPRAGTWFPASEGVELPTRPGVEPDDPMGEAGRKIFRFHFGRMLYHEPGTRLGEAIEALHDMRVATRRMRAAFRVFGSYYKPRVVAPHLKGLKRTGRALGAVRDLDVFRAKVQLHLDTLPEAQRGSLDDLLDALESQRKVARQRMVAYLDSKKYRRFVGRFGRFVETEGLGSRSFAPSKGEPQPYRVRHVAPMVVYARLAAVRAYSEWVTMPDAPLARFHALRIACKRLRYTLEFFREVLGPDTKALVKAVVTVQDHLGDLQDAVVARGILRDFLAWGTWEHDAAMKRRPDLDGPVVDAGVATYLAAKQAELQHLLDTFPQAWQQLEGAEFSRMAAKAVAVL